MRSAQRAAYLPWLAILVLLAACTAAPANPSPSPSPSAPPTAGPTVTPPPSADPSTPPPSANPSPEPTPAPSKPPAAWAKPKLIADGSCLRLSFTVDASGRFHVVAECDASIRYLTSADGSTWTSTDLAPPKDRVEQGPLLAIDGDTVHLAYSRLAPGDPGCGDDGLRDLGVYVRTRQLPGGGWSDPVRVGAEGDRLQALRVVDGVRHLTVRAANDGPVFYQSLSEDGSSRVELPNAVATSLRVGDDGLPRIAWTTGHTLRYGLVSGGRVSFQTVAKVTDTYIYAPQLVLGAGDHPSIIWSQYRDAGGGCASIDPGPEDGTYFGRLGAGGWKTGRMSTALDEVSFTLDAAGDVHVLMAQQGLKYHSGGPDAPWSLQRIPDTRHLPAGMIRIDPTTGTIAVMTVGIEQGIWLVTKPA